MARPEKIHVLKYKNGDCDIISIDEITGSSNGMRISQMGYKLLEEHFKTGAEEISTNELGNCNIPQVTNRYLIEAVENKIVLDRAFVTKEVLIEGYRTLFKEDFPKCTVHVTTLNGW